MLDAVVLSLANPIEVGIYRDLQLEKVFSSNERSSEALAILFKEIFQLYTIDRLVYTNGPGSFMAIKVSYIFLKTLSIIKSIPLFATDAFYFNDNAPIKAVAKLYFVKNRDVIETMKFDKPLETTYTLPKVLNFEKFSTDAAPFYGIGALG